MPPTISRDRDPVLVRHVDGTFLTIEFPSARSLANFLVEHPEYRVEEPGPVIL